MSRKKNLRISILKYLCYSVNSITYNNVSILGSTSSARKITCNTSKRVKNAKLTEFSSEIDQLNKRYIPKVSNRGIHKIGLFDFKSLKAIKILKNTITVDQTEHVIKLLTDEDIDPYKKKYKYLHIGLIQVAFKQPTLQGLNASILSWLRDARCLNWTQSSIGIMETSTCH